MPGDAWQDACHYCSGHAVSRGRARSRAVHSAKQSRPALRRIDGPDRRPTWPRTSVWLSLTIAPTHERRAQAGWERRERRGAAGSSGRVVRARPRCRSIACRHWAWSDSGRDDPRPGPERARRTSVSEPRATLLFRRRSPVGIFWYDFSRRSSRPRNRLGHDTSGLRHDE